MMFKLVYPSLAISLLAFTACTTSAPEVEEAPEATTPDTEMATPDADSAPTVTLPDGVTLSEDGTVIVMDEFSLLEAYCMEGDGKLAISYVGEAGGDDQLVSCGSTFDGFDVARENSFADVTIVEPAIADSALQLQDGEYTRVQCLSNQTSLEPAASDSSDGHMVLNCL